MQGRCNGITHLIYEGIVFKFFCTRMLVSIYAEFIMDIFSPFNFRKKVRVLLCAIFICAAGWGPGVVEARSITLDKMEIRNLWLLINKDSEAAALFGSLNKKALMALNEQPDPIKIAVYEGVLEKDPRKLRSKKGFKDMGKTEALAWSWVVTGDQRFLEKARQFILSWAAKNNSDGNPINETQFEPMIEAYDLIRNELPADEVDSIDNWLRDKALKLLKSNRGLSGNWQSHRLKMVGLIANAIGDSSLKIIAYDGFKQQIESSFTPNGASIDFKRRDSMHYHLYTVQPLLTLACSSKDIGKSLFSYRAVSGASLQGAVEFIRPYALGKSIHIEFANSSVKFDRIRANAGEKKYVPHQWEPNDSVGALTEAGCLDPNYDRLAAYVAGKSDKRFISWRAVLNAALVHKNPSISPIP